ncbi:hypothetical protein [Paenibacillus sp. IITD108]|uniref:hypothetical protein n=1 Tax=Paenibacillus sp. IITD108 TaxID=3116649 RepID=UPI002F421189
MKREKTIEITGLEMAGFKLSVPDGLSELLNRHNGWSIGEECNEISEYERNVYVTNGKLVSELVFKPSNSRKTA